MGNKLCWTGLAIFLAGSQWGIPAANVVGAVILAIGVVLVWLDK